MGALMLIFALSLGGETGTLAAPYPTMAACEADRAGVIMMIKELPTPSGQAVAYLAVSCVVPIKVEVI